MPSISLSPKPGIPLAEMKDPDFWLFAREGLAPPCVGTAMDDLMGLKFGDPSTLVSMRLL